MKRTTAQMIQDSIAEGYVLLEQGKGKCDDKLQEYRAQGYDVRTWYLDRTRENMNWVLYGRMKKRNSRKKVTIDYSAMTVKELKQICQEKKIPKYYKLSKEELIQKLQEIC